MSSIQQYLVLERSRIYSGFIFNCIRLPCWLTFRLITSEDPTRRNCWQVSIATVTRSTCRTASTSRLQTSSVPTARTWQASRVPAVSELSNLRFKPFDPSQSSHNRTPFNVRSLLERLFYLSSVTTLHAMVAV